MYNQSQQQQQQQQQQSVVYEITLTTRLPCTRPVAFIAHFLERETGGTAGRIVFMSSLA